jgi:starch synthase
VDLFDNKSIWEKIQVNGMNENFSWENSAKKYLDVYNVALEKRLT